jgi:ERF superfamily protein
VSDTPSVLAALSAVMEDVQAVGKGDTNTQQGYKFRGIDAVVNAVGPALRTHGVIVVPVDVSAEVEHYQTSKGTPMRDVTLTVSFRFYGPAGDYIEAKVCGESADSGDKAVPKAHSVAYRTLLLQALCIPTDEPDPDSQTNERGSMATGARADSYVEQRNGKTKPELLAYLSDILVALKTQAPSTDWTDKARTFSKDHFDTAKSTDLTKPQLQSLVDEAEKWLAHLEVEDVPFG